MFFRTLLIFCALLLAGCDKNGQGGSAADTEAPDFTGTLVWTVERGENTSLYAYDSIADKVMCLSGTWKISDPHDASFSPDGSKIVFSGEQDGYRHLFLYDLTTGKVPQDLVPEEKSECRQPVFSSDGKELVFRRGSRLSSLDLTQKTVRDLTFDPSEEYSLPSLSSDGRKVVFEGGEGSGSYVGLFDRDNMAESRLYDRENIPDGNPVAGNDNILYYTGGYSRTNPKDQIFKGSLTGLKAVYLPFNETSASYTDPCIFNDGWLVLSSDRTGGAGGYDLYVANVNDGSIHSFSVYNTSVNTADNQMDAAYCPVNVSVAEPEDGGGSDVPDNPDTPSQGDDITSDKTRPALKGKMVYHNYSSYEAGDSKMYIYEFATNKLTNISANWTSVSHPMNGHFSPDGKQLTLMGYGSDGSWDIFVYDMKKGGNPKNLTGGTGDRDEDPKFSYDGKTIAFKRNGRLAEITVSSGAVRILSSNNPNEDEYSMPFYSTDNTRLVCGCGVGKNSYIGCWDRAARTMSRLYDRAGVVEYYPITLDDISFYYTAHVSETDGHDQLYKGYWDRRTPVKLAFNRTDADYSDAYPVGSGWLLLCSTRSGSRGGYDLYIAHETSGAIYSLSEYNAQINTRNNDLGPAYYVEN